MFLLRYNAGNNGRPESTPNCTQDKDLNKKKKKMMEIHVLSTMEVEINIIYIEINISSLS